MKISTVGVGYVGLVAAACFAESGNTVYCVDKDQAKIDNLNKGIIPNYEQGLTEIVLHNTKAGRLKFTTDLNDAVNNSKVIFIGVGTPMSEDGSADLSAALTVCGNIAEFMQEYKIIVMKSTVPVGTHKKIQDLIKSKTSIPFDYVSNPEFLKEGSAVEDFMKPDRVIIGTENPDVRDVMNQLYSPFMRKSSRVMFMDAASAEIAKYASNVMLATRISFMNELSALCETFNADIEKVRGGVGSDPRIGNSFLFAGVGYGGSCFPKDVSALINIGNQSDCPMLIAQAAKQANYNQHNRFANRVIEYYKKIGGKVKLAVWGLAFKAKTDDVRESPAIWCINKFLENGFEISAFDPEAANSAKQILGSKISYGQNDYDIIDDADGLIIFTDWQQFRNPDFDLLKSKLKRSVIFDGRNLFEPTYVRKQGFEYYSIGRP